MLAVVQFILVPDGVVHDVGRGCSSLRSVDLAGGAAVLRAVTSPPPPSTASRSARSASLGNLCNTHLPCS